MRQIELLNIDCMEYMKGLPDKVFDLAICDPPYGIKEHGGKNRTGIQSRKKGIAPKNYENKGWDNATPPDEYFLEVDRVCQAWIIFGMNYFDIFVGDDMLGRPFKPPRKKDYNKFLEDNPMGWLIWDKKTNDGSDFNDCELAYTNLYKESRIFKYDWVGFGYLNNPQGEIKIHPTQKPVQLYKWILETYGEDWAYKIFDTHGGSMSIAIAAHEMELSLTLCEIDKDYYEAGVKRYNNAILQQSFIF